MMHWYALYTKPKKELQVDATLRGQGIETYLPTVQRKVRRRDRPDRVVYFPCYLFARVDLSVVPRSTIDWMPGVRRIVGTGGQPAIVDDEIVEMVRRRLDAIEEVGYGNLKHGDQVRIISRSLHRPADGGTLHIQSTGHHLASGDRQLPGGNMANQSPGACDLKTSCGFGQFLSVYIKITANGRDHPG